MSPSVIVKVLVTLCGHYFPMRYHKLVVQAVRCVASVVITIIKKIIRLLFSHEEADLVSILPKARIPIRYRKKVGCLALRYFVGVLVFNSPP